MLGDESEVLDHRLHRRVVAAALLQLQGEAFRNGPGHDAGRLEALADFQYRLDIGNVGAQRLGYVLDGCPQVAGLVGLVDQACGDQPVGIRQAGEIQLRMQVFVQRQVGGKVRGKIIIVACAAAADAGPVGLGRRAGCARRHRSIRAGARLVDILARRVELVARFAEAGRIVQRQLFAALRLFAAVGARAVAFLALVQQRVALDLGLDKLGEFLVRQLEQLDRLLQLRRHYQGLALAHVE